MSTILSHTHHIHPIMLGITASFAAGTWSVCEDRGRLAYGSRRLNWLGSKGVFDRSGVAWPVQGQPLRSSSTSLVCKKKKKEQKQNWGDVDGRVVVRVGGVERDFGAHVFCSFAKQSVPWLRETAVLSAARSFSVAGAWLVPVGASPWDVTYNYCQGKWSPCLEQFRCSYLLPYTRPFAHLSLLFLLSPLPLMFVYLSVNDL